jgi:Amt family ammonium transporter
MLLSLIMIFGGGPPRALAQSSAALSGVAPPAAASSEQVQERLSKLEQQVRDAKSSGDNAWMLTSAALVLLMTGPGLALFYGGLVRKKNVLATMMQSFTLMALITVVWALVGYSLCFSSGNRFIGGLGAMLLHQVGAAPIRTIPPPSPSRPLWCSN